MPDLALQEEELPPIGKYGRMSKRYLKEHRSVLYTNLLLSGELFPHLAEIDKACEERMGLLTHQMTKREGVTEALKATDQMEWVRRMNSIRSRAEEIVKSELIYN
ncbi:MAG: TnpV protein [Oscillospiraceae bacterium]|nr:TnpV protein [Oscillospiraceae bacterium]